MAPSTRLPPRGWTLAVAVGFGLVGLAASPAFLGAEAGAAVRHAFSAVCHQIPDRTPHVSGEALALCHRCSGMVVGLALGILGAPGLGPGRLGAIARSPQAGWLGVAVAPTAIDWALGATGVVVNTPASRLLTGAVFGLAAGLILGANLLGASNRRAPVLTPSP